MNSMFGHIWQLIWSRQMCSIKFWFFMVLFALVLLFPAYNPFGDDLNGSNNVLRPEDLLRADIRLGYDPNQSGRVILQDPPLYTLPAPVPYRPRSFVINSTLTVPMPDNDTTDSYIVLHVWHPSCAFPPCFDSSASARLIHFSRDFPFQYPTLRFDLVFTTGRLDPHDWKPFNLIERDRANSTFQPPLLADTFFDIPSQRSPLSLSDPDITVTVEFHIRRRFLWLVKQRLDRQNGTWTLEGTDYSKKEVFTEIKDKLLEDFLPELSLIFVVVSLEALLPLFDVLFFRKLASFRGVSRWAIIIDLMANIINILDGKKYIDITSYHIATAIGVWKLNRMGRGDEETAAADWKGFKALLWITIPGIVFWVVLGAQGPGIIRVGAKAFNVFGVLAAILQLLVNWRLQTVAGMSRAAVVCRVITALFRFIYLLITGEPFATCLFRFILLLVFIVWLWQRRIYARPAPVADAVHMKQD
jgi:hypothetical protein